MFALTEFLFRHYSYVLCDTNIGTPEVLSWRRDFEVLTLPGHS